MIYRELGRTGVKASILALGGHEYMANGKSRGFNENRQLAATPGYIFEGFINKNRKQVLLKALELGINYFDLTQDSEKHAFAQLMKDVTLPFEIYIQTRPEGMLYDYDPFNTKMAEYDTLKREVVRINKMLGMDRVDFLNLAPLQTAFDHDPDYMEKLADNVRRLKQEGLIRFACADTFSGEETYLRLIRSGVFDVMYVNYNFADCRALDKAIPVAREQGMGIVGREAYLKGHLFRSIAPEMGLTDVSHLADAAFKWCYQNQGADLVVYGTNKVKNLEHAARLLSGSLSLTEEDIALLEGARNTEAWKTYYQQKNRQFAGLVK